MMNAKQTGVRSTLWILGLTCLVVLSLNGSLKLSADQAQYFYDELGRLGAVVDGDGNAASYRYDKVGNLLAIVRGGNPPQIANVTPSAVDAGLTTTVLLSGTGLSGPPSDPYVPTVRLSNSDIGASIQPNVTETTVTVDLTVPALTTFGETTLTIVTPFGQDSISLTVVETFSTVIGTVVDLNGTPVAGADVHILGGPSGVSGSDGTFSFPNISTSRGMIRLFATFTATSPQLSGFSAVIPLIPNGVADAGQIVVAEAQWEPDLGQPLNHVDDDFSLVTLSQGFTFPFFAQTYTDVYVSSNGRLTFEFGDTEFEETIESFFEQPQIAAFFDDLHPEMGGDVFVNQFPDRFVVTWNQVPEYVHIGINTIQATLFADGRILLAYNGVTSDDAISGVSPGQNILGIEIDFSSTAPVSTTGTVPVYEEFDGPRPADLETTANDPFDLQDQFLLFTPNTSGGFDVGIPPNRVPKDFTTVRGRVVNEQGMGVNGALIATNTGQSGMTASDGTFTFADVPINLGTVHVTATATSGASTLVGTSPVVIPLAHGVTDLGDVVVRQDRRAMVSLQGHSTVAFASLISHQPQFVPTPNMFLSGGIITADGTEGLIAVTLESGGGGLLVYDLMVDPPVQSGFMATGVITAPHSIVFTPDERFAIISGRPGETNVVVLDMATRQVVSEVAGLPGNEAAAITPDGSHLLIMSVRTNEVSVLTLDSSGVATDTGQRLALGGQNGGPRNILITPNGRRALVSDTHANLVTILAIENGVVSVVGTVENVGSGGFGASGLAITPSGDKVYVSRSNDSTLAVLAIDENDEVTDTGVRIQVPGGTPDTSWGVSGLGFMPDGQTLVIVGIHTSQMSFLDTTTDTVSPETVSVLVFPVGVSVYTPQF